MKHWLRNSFVAGLVLIAPLVVTVVALRVVFGWVLGFVDPLVQATELTAYTANIEIIAQLVALAAIALFVVFLGALTQREVGNYVTSGLDRAFGIIPLVRVIYASVRQVSDSLSSQSSRFESVVLVEYPIEGTYAIGFVTDESPKSVLAEVGSAFNVYIPNSPNPTNGQLLLVPEDRVTEINMSPRRGIRLLVTTGMAESSSDLDALEDEFNVDLDEIK